MSQSFEATATVPLSPAEAFALAHTLGPDRTAWDTRVVKRLLLREATSLGEHAQVFERLRDGLRTILEYDVWAPGRLSSNHLVKGPWWLDRYGEGWHFHESAGGTRVTWKLVLSHRLPVFAPQAEALLVPRIQQQLDARMADFRTACFDRDLVARATSGKLPFGARHRDRSAAES